jgi:light-harvesting protein B-800-850 alpha chain
MNQGGIWCVVKPTVGLPLLLGSVATISLLVHYSVLTHTTWFADFWQGAAAAKVAEVAAPPAPAPVAAPAVVEPAPAVVAANAAPAQ